MPKHGMSMDCSRLHVIHVFSYSACVMIKQDGCIKHAPAAFVLMTFEGKPRIMEEKWEHNDP